MKKLILTLCCLAIMVPNSWDLFGQGRHTALYSYTERNAMTGKVTNDIIRLNSEKGYFSVSVRIPTGRTWSETPSSRLDLIPTPSSP